LAGHWKSGPDLHRFRLVTSTCGHDAGDDLLRWVATRINELSGPNDYAGRIGGFRRTRWFA